MQDRPTKHELLNGIKYFLEDDAIPALAGAPQFKARVALHSVNILLRELEHEENHLRAEFHALQLLLDKKAPLPPRLDQLTEAVGAMNEELAERIRRGDADAGDFRARVLDHLRRTVVHKLDVTDPRLAAAVRADYGLADA